MPMTLVLEPPTLPLTIGDDYAKQNTIKFTITLTGNGPVWLTLQIPIGENGVLRKAEDANNIQIATPGTDPPPDVLSADAAMKEWKLGDYDKGVQVNGSTTLSVSISNILCRASDKTSQLTITGATGDEPLVTRDIKITKAKPKAPDNPILYFIAEPTYLIGKGEVKLSWDLAAGTQKATLSTPSGTKSPDASHYEDAPDGTFAYTLSVGDIEKRQVTVNVLTAGWQELFALGRPDRNDKNNLGPFPSVIFDSGGRNADALYAIFVRNAKGGGREAVLCKSANGITDWEIISTGMPEGMESSPGVLLENRLWLIGGSAVDPAQISNRISYYDLGAPGYGWRDAGVEGFENGARMGHACVVVDGKTIWMLGGLDKYHTCVNDLWELTISYPQGNGEPVKVRASKKTSPPPEWLWLPRCMFSAFKHDDMIWVFGGVSSPNGDPLGDLWNSSVSSVRWEKTEAPTGLNNAIGTGAATSGSTLFTVFRTRERVGKEGWKTTDCLFNLTSRTTTSLTWSGGPQTPSKFDINEQWNAWTSTPHSIAVVGFQDRLYLRFLHRNALYGETVVVAPIFVYVNK